MTDHSSKSTPFSFRDIPSALLRSRILQVVVLLFILVELYGNAVVPLYVSYLKATIATEVARNAALRQGAERKLAEAKNLNETEVARNAARAKEAEARKAKALAERTRYESVVAEETAKNAQLREKAEAELKKAQAEIQEQLAGIQTVLASYAERRTRAEAIKARYASIITRIAEIISKCNVQQGAGGGCRRYLTEDLNPDFVEEPAPKPQSVQEQKTTTASTGSAPHIGTFRVISEVSDGKLNLRDGPGIRHGIIAEIPAGALLRQIGACVHSDDGKTRDPWCEVDWNGTKGWASSSGLEKVQGGQ
jgi:hypothetical protein